MPLSSRSRSSGMSRSRASWTCVRGLSVSGYPACMLAWLLTFSIVCGRVVELEAVRCSTSLAHTSTGSDADGWKLCVTVSLELSSTARASLVVWVDPPSPATSLPSRPSTSTLHSLAQLDRQRYSTLTHAHTQSRDTRCVQLPRAPLFPTPRPLISSTPHPRLAPLAHKPCRAHSQP